MYTEIIKIIEGGLASDKEKVINYATVLANNLEKQGESSLAKKIRSTLSQKRGALTSLDSFSTKPVDTESRMDIVELSHPQIESSQIVLSKYIQEEIYKLGLNLKCKFLDVGEGVLIGEFIKKNPKKFEINNCLNRKVNIVKPYFFTSTEGDVYLCAFRNSPSLGNLLNEDWEIVSSRINDQMNLLCGNIFPYLVKKIYTDELVNDYLTYGECYVCQKYLNSKKIK